MRSEICGLTSRSTITLRSNMGGLTLRFKIRCLSSWEVSPIDSLAAVISHGRTRCLEECVGCCIRACQPREGQRCGQAFTNVMQYSYKSGCSVDMCKSDLSHVNSNEWLDSYDWCIIREESLRCSSRSWISTFQDRHWSTAAAANQLSMISQDMRSPMISLKHLRLLAFGLCSAIRFCLNMER